ncbi:MAG TPA: glycosyltransferase family 39 protein [Ignavibacteriales bacterium]|nr:glycosyltransferase family 39 protein [Ignavibacteriales bacterium]
MIKKDVLRTLQPAKTIVPETYKILLPLVVILGFALRFLYVGAESLTFDEVYSVRLAQMSFGEIIRQTSRDFHPPLYYFLLHLWTLLFGYGETSVRALSVLFGTLSIYYFFLLAKYIFNAKTALVASFLLALSNINIEASQEARMYALLSLLAIVSMYLFLRALGSNSKALWIFYTAVNVLLLHTHVYSYFILSAEYFYFFSMAFYSKRKFKENLFPFLTSAFATAFLFMPWFFIFYRQFLLAQKILWIPRATLLQLPETLVEYSGSFMLSVIMVPLVVLSIIFISRVIKINPQGKFAGEFEDVEYRLSVVNVNEAFFLFIWLSVPVILPFVISQFLSPIFMVKYTVASSAAFILLAGKGLNNIPSKVVKMSLLVLIFGLSVFNWANELTTTNKEQWREAVAYLDSNTKKGDVIVFNAGVCRFMYEYYSKKRDAVLFPFDPSEPQMNPDSIRVLLGPVVRTHKTVWLVSSHNRDWNGTIARTLLASADSSGRQYFYSNYRKYFVYKTYDDRSADFILLRQYNSPDIKVYCFKFNK